MLQQGQQHQHMAALAHAQELTKADQGSLGEVRTAFGRGRAEAKGAGAAGPASRTRGDCPGDSATLGEGRQPYCGLM